MAARFRIEVLGAAHARKAFSSGAPALDRYFRELATQDVKRRISNCFVACDETGRVAAYYTFASTSFPLTDLPPDAARRLPRYGVVPAGLIGRLAVNTRLRGHGLGGALIIDAVHRAASADPAVYALVVDAKDDAAIGFYEHLGFARFASRPMSLYLPIAAALKAIEAGER